ncbi:hypothetical protein NP493_522g02049 [Ridgeia piscesae]|uniref:Uncharacterized protein n=1 Tax=Ridgeia piscesae TaxID=27915 RepID=A0AAD9KX60_RIDPI|nr:hypothetical protein NP493_522g02049 [Ridgeia piscesae]
MKQFVTIHEVIVMMQPCQDGVCSLGHFSGHYRHTDNATALTVHSVWSRPRTGRLEPYTRKLISPSRLSQKVALIWGHRVQIGGSSTTRQLITSPSIKLFHNCQQCVCSRCRK